MKLEPVFEEKDIRSVRAIVEEQSQRSLVVGRVQRNVSGSPPIYSEDGLWATHMMCLLTTQQPSGPNGAVYRFLDQEPFPLSLAECQKQDAEKLVYSSLSSFGGIRFSPKISKQAASNLAHLENGGWKDLLEIAERLRAQRSQEPVPAHHQLEREAALYLDAALKGFGPKQSRNFWQALGLTRYEFVLDSRILRWLRRLELPFPLTAAGLGDEEYYRWVSDLMRGLCEQACILPCVFDAAVFASYDAGEWPSDTSVW